MRTQEITNSATTNMFKIAICQVAVSTDKISNIATAVNSIMKAAEQGAQMVVLPECWNSPYSTTAFPEYAEEIPPTTADLDEIKHPSVFALSKVAYEMQIILVGGSIPEKDHLGRIFNTSVVFSMDGDILAKHRKMHLFDVNVPGGIVFKESDTLTAGDSVTVVNTPFCTIGVAICYDIRFPELSLLMQNHGAEVLIFPSAFNLTTGPAHWDILQRARAIDNQVYVVAASSARTPGGDYQAWGHSSVVAPWGDMIATSGHEDTIVFAKIDLNKVDDARRSIPIRKQKRSDLYELVQKQ